MEFARISIWFDIFEVEYDLRQNIWTQQALNYVVSGNNICIKKIQTYAN